MNPDQITNTIHFKKFMQNLTTKSVHDQRYYYYRINNPILPKSKQVYIGKYSEDKEKFIEYYFKQLLTEQVESFSTILTTKYTTSSITPAFAMFLDILRYAFYFSQKDFSQTDLEKYEQATYTKYVHGTTSVEGNTYTHRETDITLNQGQTVEGKKRQEFYEIDNYRKWKAFLEKKSDFTIDLDGIQTIHKYLLADIEDPMITPGDFRQVPAMITGTDFQPTPHILIEEELSELLEWYDINRHSRHPIELIAQFHQRFEMIHPFNDGNGRVGREIMRLQLRDFGYPPIFIDTTVRSAYLRSLDASGNGDYTDIVSFVATQVLRQTISSLNYFASFMQDLLSMPRFSQLLKILDSHPEVKALLDLVIEDLTTQISDHITDMLNNLEQSDQIYLDSKLIRQLDRILADPLHELQVNMR